MSVPQRQQSCVHLTFIRRKSLYISLLNRFVLLRAFYCLDEFINCLKKIQKNKLWHFVHKIFFENKMATESSRMFLPIQTTPVSLFQTTQKTRPRSRLLSPKVYAILFCIDRQHFQINFFCAQAQILLCLIQLSPFNNCFYFVKHYFLS